MAENTVLGKKLKELRSSFGMTQDDVAEILGMNRTSFSKYENGASNPPLPILRKLAVIYNVNLEYLIFDSRTSVRVNSSDSNIEPEVLDGPSIFTQLSTEEKKLIMKFRLLNSEKKEDIKNILDENE